MNEPTIRIRELTTIERVTIGRGYRYCIESRPLHGSSDYRPFGLGNDVDDLRHRYCWANISPDVIPIGEEL